MIDNLFTGYIADDTNENGELDFATKFAGAGSVYFILTAHQGSASPDTCGVKVEVGHRDAGEAGVHPYEPVPNVVLSFNSPGGAVTSVVEVPSGVLKALGRVQLSSTGTGDAAGAGSVTAVW